VIGSVAKELQSRSVCPGLMAQGEPYSYSYSHVNVKRGTNCYNNKRTPNTMVMDAKDYVAAEQFDVLLTDLTADDIARLTIIDVRHLSAAKEEDAPTTTTLT
jgi:hypothetical protein